MQTLLVRVNCVIAVVLVELIAGTGTQSPAFQQPTVQIGTFHPRSHIFQNFTFKSRSLRTKTILNKTYSVFKID